MVKPMAFSPISSRAALDSSPHRCCHPHLLPVRMACSSRHQTPGYTGSDAEAVWTNEFLNTICAIFVIAYHRTARTRSRPGSHVGEPTRGLARIQPARHQQASDLISD